MGGIFQRSTNKMSILDPVIFYILFIFLPWSFWCWEDYHRVTRLDRVRGYGISWAADTASVTFEFVQFKYPPPAPGFSQGRDVLVSRIRLSYTIPLIDQMVRLGENRTSFNLLFSLLDCVWAKDHSCCFGS